MNVHALIPFAVAYLLGSIPFGWVLTRLSGGGDIREVGSGNIGATNVLRTGKKGLAAATLILDALKGTAAVLIAQRFWPEGTLAAAAGAMIGHLYPVWLKFKGGKGVATFLGVIAPLLPIAGLVYAIVWLGLLATLRISSVSGMTAALSAPVTALVLGERGLFPLLLGLALLVVWRHRENIRRLVAGEEPRVGRKTA